MAVTNNRTDKGKKRMEVEKMIVDFCFYFFKGSFLYLIPVHWWLPIHFLREAQINSNSVVRIYLTWENYINKWIDLCMKNGNKLKKG